MRAKFHYMTFQVSNFLGFLADNSVVHLFLGFSVDLLNFL